MASALALVAAGFLTHLLVLPLLGLAVGALFQLPPQLALGLFIISICVNVGMWLERYVIIVSTLSRTELPDMWGRYSGSRWDWAMYLGTLGLFSFLLLVFIRFLPMISIFEMRTLLPQAQVEENGNGAAAPAQAPAPAGAGAVSREGPR